MYFQKSFFLLFKKHAPLSLDKITHMTKNNDEYADRISWKSFIDQENFYQNKDKFIHCVIHEGMHLCFEWFNQKSIEEWLIEYYIQKMYQQNPQENFAYSPICETYTEWKNCFTLLFTVLPELENHFTTYFLTGDMHTLKEYILTYIDDNMLTTIEKNHYIRWIWSFLKTLREIS